MYKENFLSGTGMGGSYIAELFIDFSYVGVAIGMVIVCMLMNKLTKGVKSNSSPYVRAFVLVAIRWVVYMPRDCFLSWATQAFSFMNIIFVVMAVLLSRIRIPRLLKRAAVTLHTRGRDV